MSKKCKVSSDAGKELVEISIPAPFGSVALTVKGGKPVGVKLSADRVRTAPAASLSAARLLSDYLDGKISALSGWEPSAEGSEFCRKVWREISKIPPGSTKTYGEIAAALSSSPRAVGSACRKNPIPLFVPCHRVVGKGTLGGFCGKSDLLEIKSWLLHHEGALHEIRKD